MADKKLIHNPNFKNPLSPDPRPVFGGPHGMARCSWLIMATNVGPGEQPEDEDVLGRLVATQMPEHAHWELPPGTWADSLGFLFEGAWAVGSLRFLLGSNCNTEHGIYVHYQGRGCLCYNLGLIWDWE